MKDASTVPSDSPPFRFQEFDRRSLQVRPLKERQSDLSLYDILPVQYSETYPVEIEVVASRIKMAKNLGASVVLMMGAHVIRSGVQRYIIDMMEKGYIDCIAMNGAGVIHDFEFALVGKTTESVARYIKTGEFGLWEETGLINDIANDAAKDGMGFGEGIGKTIENRRFPYRDISILAAGFRLGVLVTVHVGIGYDIVHEFSNCSGAAYGEISYRDFLRYAHVVSKLEHGVVMNFGSAVMAPEIFLKALAMVRNVAHQENRQIRRFTTLVCDLRDLPTDFHQTPPKTSPAYYFRPWKTMLVRTVADGGESYYVCGDHAKTIPQLWTALSQSENPGS